MVSTPTCQMLARQARRLQFPTRQCCCHRGAVAPLSARRRQEYSSKSSEPSETSAASQPSPTSSSTSAPSLSTPSSDSPSSTPRPSLYETLFPGRPAATTNPRASRPFRNPARSSETSHHRAPRASRRDDGAGSEREVKGALADDELKAWLASDLTGRSCTRRPVTGDQGKPGQDSETVLDAKNVLVLHHMSRSLVESDFYRYAPQGRHVVGWAGGIVKVFRSVSNRTREPRGQYFIFFDTSRAAQAYMDGLNELNEFNNLNAGDMPEGSRAAADAETDTFPATRPALPLGFLVPPQLLSNTELLRRIVNANALNSSPSASNQLTKSGPAPLPRTAPQSGLTYDTAVPPRLWPCARYGDYEPKGGSVLVRLVGSKITVDAMVAAIEADGVERNLPWRLIEPRPDDEHWPRQVQTLRAGSGKIYFGWNEEEEQQPRSDANSQKYEFGYTRFVITFVNMVEARRFARTWNQRQLVDARTERNMLVQATALW